MKASANLQRRQIFTSRSEKLPHEDLAGQPLPAAKPSRHGLRAVSSLDRQARSESLGVDEAVPGSAARDAQRLNDAHSLWIRAALATKVKATGLATPKLTTEEFIQVRLATVRESTRHCYWPVDVVAKFAGADVIR